MFDYLDFVPRERFRRTLAISPDGTTVAYSSNASGTFDLWTMPVSGGRPRRLTELSNQAVAQIAWAPDGKKLLFTADRGGDEQYRLYTIRFEGEDAVELSYGPDCQRVLAEDPFDAGGRFLVYAANDRDETVQDILVRDLSDDSECRISPPPDVLFTPVRISPDGRWLSARGRRARDGVQARRVRPGRWRTITAPHLVGLVRASTRFENGHLVERNPRKVGFAPQPILRFPSSQECRW